MAAANLCGEAEQDTVWSGYLLADAVIYAVNSWHCSAESELCVKSPAFHVAASMACLGKVLSNCVCAGDAATVEMRRAFGIHEFVSFG